MPSYIWGGRLLSDAVFLRIWFERLVRSTLIRCASPLRQGAQMGSRASQRNDGQHPVVPVLMNLAVLISKGALHFYSINVRFSSFSFPTVVSLALGVWMQCFQISTSDIRCKAMVRSAQWPILLLFSHFNPHPTAMGHCPRRISAVQNLQLSIVVKASMFWKGLLADYLSTIPSQFIRQLRQIEALASGVWMQCRQEF